MVMALCMISNVAVADDAVEPHPKIQTMSTTLTGFEIPFSVDNSSNKFIEVQLYVSNDNGGSWTFHQSKSVSKKNFKFSCQGDCEYWFAMKTLDRDRQLHPGGKIVVPEMKIIVDTDRPNLEFNIEPDASGRVVAKWRAEDPNLNPTTIKILQRSANGNAQDFQPVAYRPKKNNTGQLYVDQIAWWPESTGRDIEVRFEIADSAGNKASETRTTQLNQSALPRRNFSSTNWRKRQRSDARLTPETRQVPRSQAPLRQPNPQVANAKTLKSKPASWLRNAFQNNDSLSSQPPPQPRSALASRGLSSARITAQKPGNAVVWPSKTNKWVQKSQNGRGSTINENQFPIARQNPVALQHPHVDVPIRDQNFPPTKQHHNLRKRGNESDLVVTESSTMRRGMRGVAVTTKQNHQELPSAQSQSWNDKGWNNSAHVQDPNEPLEYVAPPAPTNFGNNIPAQPVSSPPSTRLKRTVSNNIQTLKANSRRFNLNYDIRSIDPSGVGKVILWITKDIGQSWKSVAVDPDNRSPFPVQVESEGTYGFKVVINSRDGLTGKPPVSGDSPDILVDVDWTQPNVQITSAPYGSGKDAGKLIIQYVASDHNLAIRPIRLLYSPQPDGPWTTIAEGLRNSGSYAWKVPSQVPEQIYLRIEVRDTANNLGVYQLTSPLDISGLVPRGRIYGVQAISN